MSDNINFSGPGGGVTGGSQLTLEDMRSDLFGCLLRAMYSLSQQEVELCSVIFNNQS